MGFWLMVLLMVFAIGVTPNWAYSRKWGYYPSAAALAAFVVVLLLTWFGVIALGLPWAYDG